MRARYTKEEISQIQALTQEGHTIKQIAETLGRPEAGIRNIRHRNKLKTKTRQTLETLRHDEKDLTRRVSRLQQNIQTLETRRQKIHQVLSIEEQALNTKLQRALSKMRNEKPELFKFTLEDQIVKMAAEISVNLFRWLIS